MAIVEAVACGLTVVRHIIYLNKSGASLNISYSNSQKILKGDFCLQICNAESIKIKNLLNLIVAIFQYFQ